MTLSEESKFRRCLEETLKALFVDLSRSWKIIARFLRIELVKLRLKVTQTSRIFTREGIVFLQGRLSRDINQKKTRGIN